MKKSILFLTTLLWVAAVAFAQNRTVRGVVLFAEDKEPVIGASVVVKGQPTIGVSTDLDGKFTLSVPASARMLTISFVGSKTQDVAIADNLRILLESDSQVLDDVVVVAYGVQKKESVVGAQTTIGAKNLEKRPITNVSNALGGVAPGVQVTLSGGQPGSSAAIRIRGYGSVNASSAPIIVVDGSIYNGSLSDINVQDIQSFDILKDAASTAIYGSSAGNGVVMITTKSGLAGATKSKPNFNFTMNQGFSRRGQDDYEKVGIYDHYTLRWRQWYNDNVYNNGWDTDRAGREAAKSVFESLRYNPYAGIVSYYNEDGTISTNPTNKNIPAIVMPDGSLNSEITGLLWGDDLDWEKALFRTGHRQEYIFSGGYNTDALKSYFSLSYLSEDGYRIETGFSRFSGRTNLSYKITPWLEVGTNSSYTTSTTTAPKQSSGSYSSNSFHFIRSIAPIYPIHQHNADGSYVLVNGERQYDYSSTRPYNGRYNPIMESLLDLSRTDRDMLTTRNFFRITPIEGLALTSNISYDVITHRTKTRYNNVMGDQPQGILNYGTPRYTTLMANQLANYTKSIGEHNFEVLLGHESYKYRAQSLSTQKQGATWAGLDEHGNYTEMSEITSSTTDYRKESYFGRLNYDYDARYNASLSVRRDGTSRLHPDKRWGTFWSVGAGWNAHRESFLKDISWLNQLKLRASYGQTGNDALSSYYPYRTTYGLGTNNLTLPGARISNFGNVDLVWETQTSTDIAIEFGLFGQLTGTIEFFNKESKDLLFEEPLPISTGVGSIDRNIGKVRNTGVEFTLKYTPISTKDWTWSINANGTLLRNKLVSLPEANRENGIEVGNFKYLEGKSIYEFFLNEFIGVDPEDGRAIYRIDAERYPNNADPTHADFAGMATEGEKVTWTKEGAYARKHFAGSSIPKLQGGFGTELRWRDVDFAMQFAYQLGGKAYDGAYQSLMSRDLSSGTAAHVDLLNAWTETNRNSGIPRLDAGNGGLYSTLTSDRFLISSDALMLKSISLGYTLPKSWTSRLGVGTTRVSLAGENLFLWTKRQGFNPMNTFDAVTGAAGYDFAKTITASLSIAL